MQLSNLVKHRAIPAHIFPTSGAMAKNRTKIRKSLLRFIPKLFDVLEAKVGMDNLKKSMLNYPLKYSSHFAGFGTAERVLRAIALEAKRRGLHGFRPQWSSPSDNDRGSQRLLQTLADEEDQDTCIFTNIIDVAGKGQHYERRLLKIRTLSGKIKSLT